MRANEAIYRLLNKDCWIHLDMIEICHEQLNPLMRENYGVTLNCVEIQSLVDNFVWIVTSTNKVEIEGDFVDFLFRMQKTEIERKVEGFDYYWMNRLREHLNSPN